MKRSLLTYFAWISLLLIAFSCRSPKIGLTAVMPGRTDQISDVASPLKMTYTARVIYKDSELSGRVLLKEDSPGNFRVAFYNELGMTFLDGTLGNKKLAIHNIIPALDNKIFLRKFEKSMKAIL
jgi:hypothetical protein